MIAFAYCPRGFISFFIFPLGGRKNAKLFRFKPNKPGIRICNRDFFQSPLNINCPAHFNIWPNEYKINPRPAGIQWINRSVFFSYGRVKFIAHGVVVFHRFNTLRFSLAKISKSLALQKTETIISAHGSLQYKPYRSTFYYPL